MLQIASQLKTLSTKIQKWDTPTFYHTVSFSDQYIIGIPLITDPSQQGIQGFHNGVRWLHFGQISGDYEGDRKRHSYRLTTFITTAPTCKT